MEIPSGVRKSFQLLSGDWSRPFGSPKPRRFWVPVARSTTMVSVFESTNTRCRPSYDHAGSRAFCFEFESVCTSLPTGYIVNTKFKRPWLLGGNTSAPHVAEVAAMRPGSAERSMVAGKVVATASVTATVLVVAAPVVSGDDPAVVATEVEATEPLVTPEPAPPHAANPSTAATPHTVVARVVMAEL